MKKVLMLIPVLVLLVTFVVGMATTAGSAVDFDKRICYYEDPVNDNCLWKCCYSVRGGEVKCTRTNICL